MAAEPVPVTAGWTATRASPAGPLLVADLTADERRAVLSGNAERLFRLAADVSSPT
jgi:hypothetical protein